MIGDAYLSFGLWAVPIILLAFGLALRFAYVRMRQGRLPAPLYALLIVQAMRILFEAIEQWGEALFILGSAVLMMIAARLLFQQQPRHGPPYSVEVDEREGVTA